MLTLIEAKRIAAAASSEAERNGWTVVIAIVDDGGHLIYLERMDDTQKASIRIAEEKARAAILFKRPTKVFEDAVADGRISVLGLSAAVPVEGGLPLVRDGAYLGAIGVSGVRAHQDGAVAAAGAAAFVQAAER